MMKPTPNSGILDIAPYVGGKSKAAPGVRVIKLASNENPLGPSPKAIEAYKAASGTLHRYPEGSAAELREAIADAHKLPADQLVCGAGSDELIGLLIHAYARAGDDIVMSRHGFLMYRIYAQSFGVNTVYAPEQNLRADIAAMLAAVTPKTRIVFLANPNNPTGSYIGKAELHKLHVGLPPYVLLVLDNAYGEYVDAEDYSDGRELVSAHDNVVCLRTFSKIYGLPALRLGWAYAPAPIVDVLNRIRGPFNVNTPAMQAGIAALRDQDYIAMCKAENAREREKISAALTALGLKVYPSQCNFVLVQFKTTEEATRINDALMTQGIIPRLVGAYGLSEYLRISVGTAEENQILIETMKSLNR